MVSVSEETERKIPDWLWDMEFCHICVDEAGLYSYCGLSKNEGSPVKECGGEGYRGEAICPTCGKPNCPRCCQLIALEDQLLGY